MTTLTNVNKPKILILDSNATPQDITANPTSVASPKVNPIRLAVASCARIGAYFEIAHTSTLSAAQKAFSWDLILAPCIDDAVNSNYTDFETAIGTFTDTTIPVAVMQVVAPGLNAAIQAVTGCGADTAAGTTSCDTFDWQGRALTKMHLYGERAVIASLHANATPLFHDGTNAPIWRFDIGAHPTMWCAGYASSLTPSTNSNISRPWICLQWMIDHQSTEAKKIILRQNIRKSYSLMWWDIFETATDVTQFENGTIAAAYDGLVAGGLEEIWIAIANNGGVTVGSVDAALTQFWIDREITRGGILRFSNHLSDFVDGTIPGTVACTTNGAAFDNFAAAEVAYEAKCDEITALGLTLGTDGYGAGSPMAIDSNYMNNPGALFCANYGMYPRLETNTLYPVGGASAETNKTVKPYSHKWNGAQTLPVTNDLDSVTYTAQGTAITAGFAYAKAFIYSAGMYFHSTKLTDLAQYTDDYTSQFLAAPDIWNSGTWEDCLANLKKGNAANILI